MKNNLLKILTLIQFIIFLIFTISQQVFFNSLWTGGFISLPGLDDLITPLSSFLIWPALIFILISIIQIYLLKIRTTFIFSLIGTSILFYVFLTEFQLMPYFSMHILIPIFSISGFTLIFYSYTLFLILFLILKNPKETAEIKKKILDLSTKLTRVEVKEISERVKIDKDTVKKIMKEMVQRKEVFGKYFSTSRALVFNQKANIDEIEQLMEIYRE